MKLKMNCTDDEEKMHNVSVEAMKQRDDLELVHVVCCFKLYSICFAFTLRDDNGCQTDLLTLLHYNWLLLCIKQGKMMSLTI